MSDRLDLDLDAALPEDGPDCPVGEWDENLLDGFPEDDPAASDRPIAARNRPAASPAVAPTSPGKPSRSEPKSAPAPVRRRGRGSGFGLGLYAGFLLLLAAFVLGAGIITATGSAPETLLDFSGLRDWTTLGDFARFPANAFWLSLLVITLVAVLVAVGIGRRLRELRQTVLAQEELLAAVGALDPDVPDSWRQEVLVTDPELAAVTGNLLGHYHLQQAKLARYVGLEGELHRLEKAMADGNLVDLQDNWDNPCAGSLADQALRLISDLNDQANATAKQQEMVASQGPDLVAGLRDARSWQSSVLVQINHQGAVVERISRRLAKLAADLPAAEGSHRRERLMQAVTAIREELAALPPRAAGRNGAEPGSLAALIERASRLAFQIAMEVARLGAKGERLLPLTQELEELTTELRAMGDRSRTPSGEEDPRERAIEKIRGRLGELDPQAVQIARDPDLKSALDELVPAAGESSAGLVKLSQYFGVQTARLKQLNALASELFGIEVDEQGDPEAAPGSGLIVERCDPFISSSQPPGGLVADPFASSGGSIFASPEVESREFAHCVLPGEESTLFASLTDAPAAAPVLDSAPDLSADASSRPLSATAEKVYDLAEFDAQLLPADPEQAAREEEVYDLSEFAAVRIA